MVAKNKRQKKYSSRVELLKIEKICAQEAQKALIKHDVIYMFDHISHNIRVVFVKEDLKTNNPVTHEILAPLLERIKKVNSKMYLGIVMQCSNVRQDNEDNFTQEELDSIEREVNASDAVIDDEYAVDAVDDVADNNNDDDKSKDNCSHLPKD